MRSERATSGSMTLRWIEVSTLASGLPLRIAVHEITGTRPGPTVGITASIHGDELAPVEAIRRLAGSLDPADMAGTLRVVPVVNPLAFQTHSRHTPHDMQNLNRVFPGDPGGWLTEQLAYRFVEEFLPGLDALIDMHAGGALATVDYAYIINDEGLSAAFETPVLYRGPGYPGTFSDVAANQGVRCVVTEFGGGLVADVEYIERTVRGLENALRYLGVLAGEVVELRPKRIVEELQVVRPRHGGLLVTDAGVDILGQVVEGGTRLGSIFNPQTFELLEEFVAPFEQTVMILTRGVPTRVEAGDYGFIVGRGED